MNDDETLSETVCKQSDAVQITQDITSSIVGLIGMFLLGYFVQQLINALVSLSKSIMYKKNNKDDHEKK